MSEKNRELKNKLKECSDLEQQLAILHNSYEGQDCYILNCGPSLNDHDPEKLTKFLEDKLTFSVKLARDRYPQVTDFHFFNCCNLPVKDHKFCHYDYSGSDTIAVASSNYDLGFRWSPFQEVDLFFKVPIRTEEGNEFLCRTKEFDKYLLEKSATRPSGPGIMLETVIHMAVHLGVKNIYALGWDLNKTNITDVNKYDHFFGSTSELLNRGDMLDWEIKETREVTKDVFYWLKEKGIGLHLVSDISALYEGIPRVKLEDTQ